MERHRYRSLWNHGRNSRVSDPTTLLAAVQVLWAAVLALIGLLGRRLHEDLRSNTQATQDIARNLNELTNDVVGQYATRDETDRTNARHAAELKIVTEKFDKLNREMGEVTVLMRLYSEVKRTQGD